MPTAQTPADDTVGAAAKLFAAATAAAAAAVTLIIRQEVRRRRTSCDKETVTAADRPALPLTEEMIQQFVDYVYTRCNFIVVPQTHPGTRIPVAF